MAAISVSSIKPAEQGTAVVTLAFTDEDEATVVPTSLSWQLMRVDDGSTVNERTFANCSFSGSTIVLSGDDLATFGLSDTGDRVLSVQGVYTSSAGSDLPLKGELSFTVEKLLGQIDIET